MNLAELKRAYGDEYPLAVISDGIRLPLRCERRFSRYYHSDQHNTGALISRFMDGSASMKASELEHEWAMWTEEMRWDFCGSCCWLHEQPDFPEMLRFIMQHGGPDDWSAVANSVGTHLPQGEAFDLLTRALRSTEPGRACNIVQGLSLTKHPDAERVLRKHLANLWSNPALWDDNEFSNPLAYAATCCIEHLIEDGAPPQDFREEVRALARHPCAGNRDSCHRFLAKHFSWLNGQTDATENA